MKELEHLTDKSELADTDLISNFNYYHTGTIRSILIFLRSDYIRGQRCRPMMTACLSVSQCILCKIKNKSFDGALPSMEP